MKLSKLEKVGSADIVTRKNTTAGNIVGILILVAFLYYYGEFIDWFSERTGGPARYVENQNR